MEDKDIKLLTDEDLKLIHNEYNRRWRKKHKESVSAYNIEYYKKCKGHRNNINECRQVDISEVALQPIL